MKRILIVAFTVVLFASFAGGQDNEKAMALFRDAIDAMGGDAYLKVTDVASEGIYYLFDNAGNSSNRIKFNDNTKYPDKSRFESGNKKKERDITVFNLEKNEGWILEGQKETREATPDEMKDFRNTIKHANDMIFRFRCKDPANKLFYIGPGEGRDASLDMVKIVDPENDEVTVYFDRISKLPAKIEYRLVGKKGVRQRHVEEYSQWHIISGINTPLRIDNFVNGRSSSQTFIEKISYNNNLPDSIFSKPVQAK